MKLDIKNTLAIQSFHIKTDYQDLGHFSSCNYLKQNC